MAATSCPQCGKPVDSRSPFCGNCGYALQTGNAATAQSPSGQQVNQPPYPVSSPYSTDRTSSSAPTYRMNDAPLSYPSANMPSSPNYGAGMPPPPPSFYQNSGTPSAANYSPSSADYPTMSTSGGGAGTPAPASSTPSPTPQPPSQRPPRRNNIGVIVISILVILLLLAGGVLYLSRGSLLKGGSTGNTGPNLAATSNAQTATANQAATSTAPTATTDTGATPTDTSTTQTGTTPTVIATSPTNSANSYTAIQPGPGCDTSGGTWTPQSITGITCGTQISVKGGTRGYLYLQLPGNKAFSANNVIGISGTDQSDNDCIGLAEQGANSGYLAEFCGNGDWYIYSISSGGAVVQTLAKNITSTRPNEQLSLTFKGSTLSFSIDTEVHTVNITAIQPTKVAVTSYASYYDSNETVTNFSYTGM